MRKVLATTLSIVTMISLSATVGMAQTSGARSQDIQAQRSQDIQSPRGQDIQSPRGQDIQSPRSADFKKA